MGTELFITVSVTSANNAIATLHDARIRFEYAGSNSYFFNSVEDFVMARELLENGSLEIEDLSYVEEDE